MDKQITPPSSLWAFEGRWSLSRQITDRLGGASGHLTGQARFTRSGDRLILDEDGALTLTGAAQPIRATRRYLWADEGDRISVRFDDGRPFHDFPLDTAEASATHLCTPDHYAVSYSFARWPHWSAQWTVTGPRKDYTMTSDYAPSS